MLGHADEALEWMRKGRKWLENRSRTIIEDDGSFSQYSITYHRLMLDTFSFAEAWRRHRDLAKFSKTLHDRLQSTTLWLGNITNQTNGDVPNIGANDGAQILHLVECDHRDFRPSVQLGAALFCDGFYFECGAWNNMLSWLDVEVGAHKLNRESVTYDKGGFHVLVNKNVQAVLRYPRFRFRPSQADAMHLDVWINDNNLLRDAGTFSYNSSDHTWFSGTSAHNTIEFDGRDQMMRLGRFLFGDWLRSTEVSKVADNKMGLSASAAYEDRHGARHERDIVLKANELICKDTVSGVFDTAKLRWRLAPGDWKMSGQKKL